MNYVILRKFLTIGDCQALTATINHVPTKSEPLGLDGNSLSNTWIDSSQSKGLQYMYSTNMYVLHLAKNIKQELKNITGISFFQDLEDKALCFCKYGDGAMAKGHRDRNKTLDGTGEIKFQDYTCIALLTQPGIDYVDKEDRLYINFDVEEISPDGKKVLEAVNSSRLYPNLQKGDVIIFRNNISIHGVDPIDVLEGQQGRITCGFRSK